MAIKPARSRAILEEHVQLALRGHPPILVTVRFEVFMCFSAH